MVGEVHVARVVGHAPGACLVDRRVERPGAPFALRVCLEDRVRRQAPARVGEGLEGDAARSALVLQDARGGEAAFLEVYGKVPKGAAFRADQRDRQHAPVADEQRAVAFHRQSLEVLQWESHGHRTLQGRLPAAVFGVVGNVVHPPDRTFGVEIITAWPETDDEAVATGFRVYVLQCLCHFG